MQRDINMFRDFETGGDNKEEFDIIRKKNLIKDILLEDPDIKEVLGAKDDTEAASLIVNWLKLNGIQSEVSNFIMFDIKDVGLQGQVSGKVLKDQYLDIRCLVHENNMGTDYGIARTDLLDYLVKDLFNHSNILGMQLTLVNDVPDIIDKKYYSRNILFRMTVPNGVRGNGGNQYDRFRN